MLQLKIVLKAGQSASLTDQRFSRLQNRRRTANGILIAQTTVVRQVGGVTLLEIVLAVVNHHIDYEVQTVGNIGVFGLGTRKKQSVSGLFRVQINEKKNSHMPEPA